MPARIAVTPDMLDATAARFERDANQIHETLAGLHQAVQSVDGDWRGMSRAQFLSTWSRMRGLLDKTPADALRTSRVLRDIATAFRQAEQRGAQATRRDGARIGSDPGRPISGLPPGAVRIDEDGRMVGADGKVLAVDWRGLQGKIASEFLDGGFVGADGTFYPPDTPLSQIPGITDPSAARTTLSGQRLYIVNGINTDAQQATRDAARYAGMTGANVVGIYNDAGAMEHIKEATNPLELLANPAVKSLYLGMKQAIDTGQPMNIMAHSNGNLVANVAATLIRDYAQQTYPDDVAARLGNIHITALGSPIDSIPQGISYERYTNDRDPVTWLARPLFMHDDAGIRFDDPGEVRPPGPWPWEQIGTDFDNVFAPHSNEIYLEHWQKDHLV